MNWRLTEFHMKKIVVIKNWLLEINLKKYYRMYKYIFEIKFYINKKEYSHSILKNKFKY